MTRSSIANETLVEFGWFPGRSVSGRAGEWRVQLESIHTVHSAAFAIWEEFGGIFVPANKSTSAPRYELSIDPRLAEVPFSGTCEQWLGAPICPIGEYVYFGITHSLVADPLGRIFIADLRCPPMFCAYIADDWDAALDTMLAGLPPQVFRRPSQIPDFWEEMKHPTFWVSVASLLGLYDAKMP